MIPALKAFKKGLARGSLGGLLAHPACYQLLALALYRRCSLPVVLQYFPHPYEANSTFVNLCRSRISVANGLRCLALPLDSGALWHSNFEAWTFALVTSDRLMLVGFEIPRHTTKLSLGPFSYSYSVL